MKKVVLTGGPSAGKSTALRYLQDKHPSTIATAPESATLLLEGGFPAPNEEHPWTPEWQRSFQIAIAATQIALEQTIEKRAEKQGKDIIICDRGLADGAAYLLGGIDELSEITGYDSHAILNRYGLVIHLTSTVTHSAGYQKHTNKHRFEEAADARRLEDRTLAAWEDHPNRLILDIEDVATRNQEVTRAILDLS